MATVELKIDPANLFNKRLTPIDAEAAAVIIELFYLVCFEKEHHGSAHKYFAEYDAELKSIDFHSPLKLLAYFKSVSVNTAKHVFEMVTYYTQEKERRELVNTEKKLDLLEKAWALRKRMIKDGVSSDEATRMIAEMLTAHKAQLAIRGPERAPDKEPISA
jgi:hypothetical protein